MMGYHCGPCNSAAVCACVLLLSCHSVRRLPPCCRYALVMEYYSGGTLMAALGSDSRVLGWRQRITLALQVRQQAAMLYSFC